MFEQASKEVQSLEAVRELGVAKTALKRMAKEIQQLDFDDETISQAIKVAQGTGHKALARRLQEILDRDPGPY